jgi:hypothetical protein
MTGYCDEEERTERAFLFPAASFFLVAATLFCSDAQSQEGGRKNGFCWEVYPARQGDTLVKITKWPRSTHRNIRWDCQAGGCQVEGDVLHLPTGLAGPTHQVSVQACTRHRLRRSTCSAWTSFTVP